MQAVVPWKALIDDPIWHTTTSTKTESGSSMMR
jgi:hypothetical protein